MKQKLFLKKPPYKQKSRSRWLHRKILPNKGKFLLILLKFFEKTEEDGTLLKTFYKATIILISESNKDTIKKEDYRPISLMNIDAKILNKILANWILPHMKRIIHHERFIPSLQGWLMYTNQSLWYITTKEKTKPYDHPQQMQNNHLTKFNIHSWQKALNQCGYRGNISQHNNSPLWPEHNQYNCTDEKLKAFPLKSGTKQGGQLSPLLFNTEL